MTVALPQAANHFGASPKAEMDRSETFAPHAPTPLSAIAGERRPHCSPVVAGLGSVPADHAHRARIAVRRRGTTSPSLGYRILPGLSRSSWQAIAIREFTSST